MSWHLCAPAVEETIKCSFFLFFFNKVFIFVFLPHIYTSALLPWDKCRADSKLAPSWWGTSFQSNAVSHWLGTNLESALKWFLWRSTSLWHAFPHSSAINLTTIHAIGTSDWTFPHCNFVTGHTIGLCLFISPRKSFLILLIYVAVNSCKTHLTCVLPVVVQLSCSDTCQIWMRYSIGNWCFRPHEKMGK